jgi:Mrp family chromosome partitioning ATPase
MLRSNLEFVSLGHRAQVVMVTSAREQEGKSTTIANLAVAVAAQGKRVALIDLDLRRPMLERLFKLSPDRPGLTDIVLGYAVLDDALVRIPHREFVPAHDDELFQASLSGPFPRNGNGGDGLLEVLPCGQIPPVPGEFIGLDSVRHIIAALRERADLILIDTPPALTVGDATTIAGFSDAVLVAIRAESARRPAIAEFSRVLHSWPAERLGFVLCGTETFGGYSYYGYGGYAPKKQRAEQSVR